MPTQINLLEFVCAGDEKRVAKAKASKRRCVDNIQMDLAEMRWRSMERTGRFLSAQQLTSRVALSYI
jgi:hypothetical protein